MKKFLCMVLLVSFSVSIFSCGMVKGKGEAEDVAESFLKERIENGWSGTDPYYSEIFWDATTHEKWGNIQNIVLKTMGELKTFSLESWNVQNQVHTNELSGTIVRLVYETEYEKGKGMETLVLHKSLLGKKFSIIGHTINSPQIQKVIEDGIQKAAVTSS